MHDIVTSLLSFFISCRLHARNYIC